jgi:hypothetical protein
VACVGHACAEGISRLLQILYVLRRTSADFRGSDRTCARGPQCATLASASRTEEGQGAPDKRRGRSVPHDVKRTQVGPRSPAHVHRCRQDSPPLALFPSVIALPSTRVAGKRAKYALEASRRTSGRRKIWRWRRQDGWAAWFANPLGAGRKRVRRDKVGGTPKA